MAARFDAIVIPVSSIGVSDGSACESSMCVKAWHAKTARFLHSNEFDGVRAAAYAPLDDRKWHSTSLKCAVCVCTQVEDSVGILQDANELPNNPFLGRQVCVCV